MRWNAPFTGKLVAGGTMSHTWRTIAVLGLVACGGGGGVTGDPPQISMFAAAPDTVIAGVATNVTWTWDYANDPDSPECEILELGMPMTSGGSAMVTLSASTTYTLRCTNSAGSDSAVAPVSVALDPVAPSIATLTASPMQILTGTATDVTFAWTYAMPPAPTPTCMLDHGIGAVTSGVAKNLSLQSTTQLVLTCTNSEGTDTKNITITTVAAPVAPDLATFTTTPSTVVANTATNVTFNWTYTGTPTPAPTCTIDNGINTITQGQTKSVNIAANTTYTLTCTNSAGTDTRTATINAQAQVAPDIATFTANPMAVPAGTATAVTWTWTYNGTPVPAATCSIDNNVGAVANGDTTTVNIAADTLFTLTCTNAVTSDTATLTITVI
jgi:hypothetical protein